METLTQTLASDDGFGSELNWARSDRFEWRSAAVDALERPLYPDGLVRALVPLGEGFEAYSPEAHKKEIRRDFVQLGARVWKKHCVLMPKYGYGRGSEENPPLRGFASEVEQWYKRWGPPFKLAQWGSKNEASMLRFKKDYVWRIAGTSLLRLAQIASLIDSYHRVIKFESLPGDELKPLLLSTLSQLSDDYSVWNSHQSHYLSELLSVAEKNDRGLLQASASAIEFLSSGPEAMPGVSLVSVNKGTPENPVWGVQYSFKHLSNLLFAWSMEALSSGLTFGLCGNLIDCPESGRIFPKDRGNQRYCSTQCRSRYGVRKWRERKLK